MCPVGDEIWSLAGARYYPGSDNMKNPAYSPNANRKPLKGVKQGMRRANLPFKNTDSFSAKSKTKSGCLFSVSSSER